jgi:Predicted solute binding protein
MTTLFTIPTQAAGTSVGRILTSDASWTKNGSPYNLTDNLVVSEGVTLTIEAGVTVNLNSHYMDINGTLQAMGIPTDKIIFNCGSPITYNNFGQIYFTKTSTPWDESTGKGCIIQNDIINAPKGGELITTVRVESSPKFCNNTIHGVTGDDSMQGPYGLVIDSGSPIVTGNVFEGNGHGLSTGGTQLNITGNTFIGNAVALTIILVPSTSITIANNSFCDSKETGLAVEYDYYSNEPNGSPNGYLNVTNNLFLNNGAKSYSAGIDLSSKSGSIYITNNTIANHRNIGVLANLLSPVVFRQNNIVNNTLNFKYAGTGVFDAAYNWWGTANPAAINQSIYDNKNEFVLGNVTYEPYLKEPNPQAPAVTVPTPIPTPTPMPTVSPEATPTANQTDTPTSTPIPMVTPQPKTNSSICATTDTGRTVYIALNGNITGVQVANAFFTASNSTTTILRFTVTGEAGHMGFCNMTIPKSFELKGSAVIYIDGLLSDNQGYVQDADDYYVWFTTHFSTHQIAIVFSSTDVVQGGGDQGQFDVASILYGLAVGVAVAFGVIVSLLLVMRLRRNKTN